MMLKALTPKIALFSTFLGFFACNEDDEIRSLRPKIDYATLSPTAPYSSQFADESGTSTVDLADGNHRLKMFQSLNYYSTSNVAAGTAIDGNVLSNMFSNTGSPFFDISTTSLSISGAELNAAEVQLRDAVAASLGEEVAEGVRQKMETWFSVIDGTSDHVNQTASKGVPGKLGNYLLDAKGVEIAQVIQKSLIGALQLDYIGNVLLDEGLSADNTQPVADRNFTQLEHNWDEAYGLLTLNPVYLDGATDTERNSNEFGLGAYLWEYNRDNYVKIYPSFLKGRAAIVNNDKDQYQVLATFLRMEMEKTMARAAVAYLNKWKTETTDESKRAHAMGEALGFIYSLRFAELHGGNAEWSDKIWTDLIDTPDGFWDLDAGRINAAADAITERFDL